MYIDIAVCKTKANPWNSNTCEQNAYKLYGVTDAMMHTYMCVSKWEIWRYSSELGQRVVFQVAHD